jgi:hypothetical protein
VGDKGVQLAESPRIEQPLGPFARSQLALGVLAFDSRHTAAQLGLLAHFLELLDPRV